VSFPFAAISQDLDRLGPGFLSRYKGPAAYGYSHLATCRSGRHQESLATPIQTDTKPGQNPVTQYSAIICCKPLDKGIGQGYNGHIREQNGNKILRTQARFCFNSVSLSISKKSATTSSSLSSAMP
jgi:hypothetical protein